MTPEELETIKIALDNGLEIKDEAIRMLITYIEELESQIPLWIPVEERLPEESGYYLCWDIIACESAIPYVAVCCFRKERGSFDSCSDLCITHWQPLPKGPEE